MFRKRALVRLIPAMMLAGGALISCQTSSNDTVEEEPRPYYSPFREGGGLTAWVEDAIKRGIGLQIHPDVAPYPDNRAVSRKKRISREELEEEGAMLSERVASMIGGWERIALTSDKQFDTLERLAWDMSNYTEEPRYAEAVNATMMLYPALRAIYYPVTGGGNQDWGVFEDSRGKKRHRR